jgi:hypothetical protein
LKLALDSGEYVQMDDDRWYDINAIAGAFKMFMRELPDRALGAEALEQLKNVTGKHNYRLPNIATLFGILT